MGLLADLFVQFSAKGQEKVKGAMGDIQATLDTLADRITRIGDFGTNIFGGLTSRMLGFAQAGFAGTAQGERLAFTMQQLSREVASAFLPAMERLISLAEGATNWFRSLSGSQQDLFANSVLLVAGMGAVGKIANTVASVFGVLRSGVGWAVSAFSKLGSVLGFAGKALALFGGGWVGLVLKIAAAAGAALGAGALLRKLFGGGNKPGENHRSLDFAGGRVGSSDAELYRNVQVAALKTGKQLDQEKANEEAGENIKTLVKRADDTNKKLDQANSTLGAIKEKKLVAD